VRMFPDVEVTVVFKLVMTISDITTENFIICECIFV
jgi:hypothetical protein